MRICIFGDSITWGEGDKEIGGWADRLKVHLMERDFSVYNLGIRGDTSAGVLDRFKQEIAARSRKLGGILFAIGINDCLQGVSVEEFQNNMRTLMELSPEFADTTIMIGLTRTTDTSANEKIEQFNKELEVLCRERKVLFIPMFDLFATDDLTKDGLHPSPTGYKKMFERIKLVLEPLLPVMTVDQ